MKSNPLDDMIKDVYLQTKEQLYKIAFVKNWMDEKKELENIRLKTAYYLKKSH